MLVVQLYLNIIPSKFLYEEEQKGNLGTDLSQVLSLLFMNCIANLFLAWIGSLFVEAELPRQGNEKLLNGLKEGILILEEDSSTIQFHNQAALRLITKYSEKFSINFIDEKNTFEKEREMFAFVNMAEIFEEIFSLDYHEIKKKI